ncbi:MAG TPA: glycosyltransferase, partial [Kiritimatiellia bacterium]|nr:glycosyltransferase [Kiritimatiellia bacterium]
ALVEEAQSHGARQVYLLTDISLLQEVEPTPAEQALFPPTGAGCRFVYVGNLESYQGIDLLVAAFHRLVTDPTSSPAQLIVAGGVPGDIARYEAMCRQLGVADRVRFIGPQPVDRLGAMLALADVLVSPRTQGNNTPMKIYSYMASGKPLLATALPTHTQVLNDETACLAAPEPAAFAEGMRRLAVDPELRARLGAAAQARAEAAHSWPAFQRTVNQIYDDLAARQGQ